MDLLFKLKDEHKLFRYKFIFLNFLNIIRENNEKLHKNP
jgi:hypothetical protein